MANNSLINEEQFNTSIQQLYAQKIFPYLNGATHTGCVPLGTVLPYYGETAPEHFLICDGTEYLKSDYGELATHLLSLTDPTPYQGSDSDHFKVPDLRGEFLRGSGTNSHSGQGSGGAVGEHQDGTEEPYLLCDTGAAYIGRPASGQVESRKVDYQDSTNHYVTNIGSGRNNNPLYPSYHTSRPTNTSVTYIIAYQNAYIDLALDGFPIDITQPQDGQLLMYDATAGRWVNGGHKYSTDEHVVGTWIDGKPIYEKTISGTLSSGEQETITVSISDVEFIVHRGGTFVRYDGYQQELNSYVDPNNYTFTNIKPNSNNIDIYINKSVSYYSSPYVITLRYTKTTD